MKIIISPFSSKTFHVKENAKNYPYWKDFLDLLKEHELIQIGVEGEEKLVEDCRFNLSSEELLKLAKSADIFISVDNFFPHFCNYYGISGIVIFSKSDPKIFGYKENFNILKSESSLRTDTFGQWHYCEADENDFFTPIELVEVIKNKFGKLIKI